MFNIPHEIQIIGNQYRILIYFRNFEKFVATLNEPMAILMMLIIAFI